MSPLPPPMPSWTQLHKKHVAPSKKWKIPASFLSHDYVQQTQNAEDSVPSLPPPMLNLTQMQYPNDSCVEGFAISTPVGYFPAFFPQTLDPPSPITASSFEKLPTRPSHPSQLTTPSAGYKSTTVEGVGPP